MRKSEHMKNFWMTRFFSLMLLGFALVGFTACSQNHIPAFDENPVLKNLPDRQRQLLADIEKSGIQVIRQGMVFTFAIPTDEYFERDSRELKSIHEQDLDHLAEFLHRYSVYLIHPRVMVAGYTDKVWLAPARDHLSMRYADAVATYLREDGLNPDMIYMRGFGAKNPVASNHYPLAASFNRRVVVTIR